MSWKSKLTIAQVAARCSPSDPAAVVAHVLPLAAEIPVDEVGVLTADGHVVKMVTEVLQLHPGKNKAIT